ncbi:MAG TPA: HAMP domain-containing sensor histidine kinase [Acidimicrobiales bacterium]|nr:HAMP domain-containing sensor histidine kinase [Acidimicrobiales bacterium]
MSRSRLFGLRGRVAIGFALTGLVVAVAVAVAGYVLARRYLLEQRDDAARSQAYAHARLVRSALRASDADLAALMASIDGGNASDAALRYHGEWYATVIGGADAVPRDLTRVVGAGHAGLQRTAGADGRPRLAVGVPVRAVDAEWYEIFPLDDVDRTLSLFARASSVAAVAASVVAGGLGWASAGRAVRPLAPVGAAAARIAAGDLATRLPVPADGELRPLVVAFNDMAAALESRVEREIRFTADVTHELRSPLAAIRASVDVLQRRRATFTADAAAVLDVLTQRVAGFERTVVELLDIARSDAGTAEVRAEPVDLEALVRDQLDEHAPGARLAMADGAPREIVADRRRLAQALANVMVNAGVYAGGTTQVTVAASDGGVRIVLDDDGPGVPPEERDTVFRRFARGSAGVEAGTGTGTGLGLALVEEHLRLHGGRAWVEEAPGGGARFVFELPGIRP